MRMKMLNVGVLVFCLTPTLIAQEESNPEELTPSQDQDLRARAKTKNAEMLRLYGQGKGMEAMRVAAEVLAIRKKLHAGKDHHDIATGLSNLGSTLQAIGRYEKALLLHQDALDMRKRLSKGQDHPSVANSLNNMGGLLGTMGWYEKALLFHQEALDMRKRLSKGQDHPSVANSSNNLGSLLQEMGHYEKALPFLQDALDMRQRLFKGQDHPSLAISLNNLGTLLQEMGHNEKALPFLRDALDVYKRLFKGQDHPLVAHSLNNMGALHQKMRQLEKAQPFLQDALDMYKRLSMGRDHPHLAHSLNNMGVLFSLMGQYEKALRSAQDSLDMRRRLFEGQDHPFLASSLNNLGSLLKAMGQYEKALPFVQDALNMRQRLFRGQDHRDLAQNLKNMGYLLSAMGEPKRALAFFKQALDIQRRLGDRYAYSTSLTNAIEFIARFADFRAAFLSALGADPEVDGHAVVWTHKAALAQLYRTRRLITNSRESDQVDDLQGQIRLTQRRLSGLIATPSSPERNRDLGILTDRQQDLERQLARLLPDWQPHGGLKLAQLLAALSPGDVFLDFYQYKDWSPENRQWSKARYVAFVATSQGSHRVELGPATPIDSAIEDWRLALVDWTPIEPTDTTRFAARVRLLLWKPIEAHLPKEAKRIFVSPDGDLGRVPFAALPGTEPGSILLERLRFATIESGPNLLERLTKTSPTRDNADTLLITGGVNYDPPGTARDAPWGYLKGSEKELREVRHLWGQRGDSFAATGHEATTTWLLENLPKVRYAHLATHGQFNATEYAREQIRLADARKRLFAGQISEENRVGLGATNPLGYVGVVMAGANAPSKDDPDRGIVAGTSIWPMDLSGLDLVVLSACQTGLGKNTGSAGVANLTLAFHIAGCRNVIASLWEVPDAATAALMARFYQALWDENKSPLEALRDAQLYVYRNPEVAMNWDQIVSRGKTEEALRAPKKVAAELPDGGKHLLEEPTAKTRLPERTPAKYWAAFTLSGVGK